LSLGHRKSGSLWLALLAGVCLAAASPSAEQPSPTEATKTTAPQKSKSTALPGPEQPATKNSVAKSKTQYTAAKKGTSHAAAKSATKKRASPTPATASARKPVTHSTGAATHQAAAVHKTGTRKKPARTLTGRQRLARLHLEPDRVQEIQQALVREGYLQGDANGRWDDRTRAAMLRYQTDHGFSATGLPDAKSIMKLGLGPHPLPLELDPDLARAPGPDAAKGNPPAEPLVPPASGEETTPQEK